MPNSIIIYTYAYHPEEGIVNDFLSSDEFRELYENNEEPPLLTPLPTEQILDYIDRYTSANQLTEDERGALVAWFNGLDPEGKMFIGLMER